MHEATGMSWSWILFALLKALKTLKIGMHHITPPCCIGQARAFLGSSGVSLVHILRSRQRFVDDFQQLPGLNQTTFQPAERYPSLGLPPRECFVSRGRLWFR
jgi:hypothetical protein